MTGSARAGTHLLPFILAAMGPGSALRAVRDDKRAQANGPSVGVVVGHADERTAERILVGRIEVEEVVAARVAAALRRKAHRAPVPLDRASGGRSSACRRRRHPRPARTRPSAASA